VSANGDRAAIASLRATLPDLVSVYRFGSTTRGEGRADSDLDFAVLPAAPLAPADRFALEQDLASQPRRDVDLVELARASTVMRAQVISAAPPIFVGDQTARATIEMYAYADYARLNEERRPILERVAREGSIHGR
jgi:predicted nucleotidyltransferase